MNTLYLDVNVCFLNFPVVMMFVTHVVDNRERDIELIQNFYTKKLIQKNKFLKMRFVRVLSAGFRR